MRMVMILLIVIISSNFCSAQLNDDFSDGNLDQNPSWNGDVSNFIVNTDLQLQLNAPEAGESFLYSPLTFQDSTEWNLWFDLDFSPSNGNKLLIYLFLDNEDFAVANGYFLEIGEDGSADAIGLYSKQGTSTTLLGSGTMSAVANDPARARISIKKTIDGIWNLKTDYSGGNLLLDDLMVIDNTIPITGNGFFGFHCTYTSTRVDKFFFDDIDIKTPEQDLNGPVFVAYELIAPDSIVLSFNEILLDDNIPNDNIYVDQGFGNASSILVNPLAPNSLEVKFSQNLSSGTLYQICAEGIQDLAGNPSDLECQDIFLTVDPELGDVFINEILFNPNTGGSDFVEIINVSDKFISLNNITIANFANGQRDQLISGLVMQPNEILAFTNDPQDQIDFYEPLFPNNIIDQDIPSFNADEGNVSLLLFQDNVEITIDSFDYNEDMHFVLLDNVKGASLEKIVSNSDSNAENAWHSASEQVNFATPGYENSNGLNVETSQEMISLPYKVFSPNGDGDKEFLTIAFNLDSPGYLANVKVFDDRGHLVQQLTNNLLLGNESYVYWDGISTEGAISDIGIYIVLVELFDANGKVEELKETFVLADFLD